MIMLVIPYVGFLLGYGGMAAMTYTVRYVRGYYEVRDGANRLVVLTMRWAIVGKKMVYNPAKLPVIRS